MMRFGEFHDGLVLQRAQGVMMNILFYIEKGRWFDRAYSNDSLVNYIFYD